MTDCKGLFGKIELKPMNDEEIKTYINEAFSEEVIRRSEDHLLQIMKFRYENYPTKKNDREWLDYSSFVCRRRCQSEAKADG